MSEPALILATRNKHKVAEMAALLPGVGLRPLPPEVELPPETGETFEANALIKARAAHAALPEAVVVADDSGIEAEDLGGAPGIYSARYAGPEASDEVNLEKLLREVDAAGGERRAAYVCALALIDADGAEHLFLGRCEGRLLREPTTAAALGRRGRERVTRDYLITGLLGDYLRLVRQIVSPTEPTEG